VRLAVIAAVLGSATAASASPLADALAKHDDAAVAGLRAQLPGDADVRCTLGAVYGRRGDLSRADLYLAGCVPTALAPDIADAVERAQRDTARALRDSELAGIDIDAHPDGLDAEVDALPGERFTISRVVWVPAGHRVVRVYAGGQPHDFPIDLKPHSHAPLTIHLDAPAAATPHTTTASFGEDEPVETVQGPPPNVQHPPMKIHTVDDHQAAGGEQIDDPFVSHRTVRPVVFGVRIGGGVFDETGGTTSICGSTGPAAAATASTRSARRSGPPSRSGGPRRWRCASARGSAPTCGWRARSCSSRRRARSSRRTRRGWPRSPTTRTCRPRAGSRCRCAGGR
jgi:hypothetical protein